MCSMARSWSLSRSAGEGVPRTWSLPAYMCGCSHFDRLGVEGLARGVVGFNHRLQNLHMRKDVQWQLAWT